MKLSKWKVIVALGVSVVCVVVILMIFSSIYTVEEGERGLVVRNDVLISTVEPGTGMKIPIIDQVVKFSTQPQSITIGKINASSKDKKDALLELSVTYHIPADKVDEFFAVFKDEKFLIGHVVEPKVIEISKATFGQFNAAKVMQSRALLEATISQTLQDAVKGPVVIDSVQVKDITLTDANESSAK